MLVTIATATVSCCYQVPGQHNVVDTESTVVKGDLFKDYCNFTHSNSAVCSFYAVASWAATFCSHLLEQIHQSRPWTCSYQA